MEAMNELALFAGGGGGLLGSKLLGWRTICYVENEPYTVEVLKARIQDGMLDDGPIWDDVRTFDGRPWAGLVDVLTAGFPCQPWSLAGRRDGERDERNLWPDTLRVIREVGPGWCLLENVPGLLSKSYIQQIFGDLAESGYDCRWDCIPAAFVGAPHLRYRLWIVAHTQGGGERGLPIRSGGSYEEEIDAFGIGEDVPDADGEHDDDGRYGRRPKGREYTEIIPNTSLNELQKSGDQPAFERSSEIHWWDAESELGRVADGVAHRVDRLRAIGNGQVPGVVRAAWEILGGG